MALDLSQCDPEDGQPWDFNDPAKMEKARKLVNEKRAILLIGSPMCSAFSKLQDINFARMTKEEVDRVIAYGTRHLEFCMELYQKQMENGSGSMRKFKMK